MTPLTREQIDSLRAELKATIHLFATNMKPEQRHAKCATFLLENGSNVFALLDIAEAALTVVRVCECGGTSVFCVMDAQHNVIRSGCGDCGVSWPLAGEVANG